MKVYVHRSITFLVIFALIAPLLPPPTLVYSQTADNLITNTSAVVTISFDGQQFIPAELTVSAGTEIIWLNQSSTEYTIEARLENRIYLPLIASDTQMSLIASDQSMMLLAPVDSIIFTEPFRANSSVTYKPTGVGELTYNLVGFPTMSGMIHVVTSNVPTPTDTPIITPIATATEPTSMGTPSATLTEPTPTAIVVETGTPTVTPTTISAATETRTATPTEMPTETPLHTPSSTPIIIQTATATASPSSTFTPAETPTVIQTATATASPPSTFTPTETPTHTPSSTPIIIQTATVTASPSSTFTPTETPMITSSPTATPTAEATITSSPTTTTTATGELTPVHTPTSTATDVITVTPTAILTESPTPTMTESATATPTATEVATETATPTPAVSPTVTPTFTPTFTPTATKTTTVTATASPMPTLLASPTTGPSITPVQHISERLTTVLVPGTIAADTTWGTGTVYLVSGLTTLNSGVTLTIEAGTIIKFQPKNSTPGRLLINGIVLAQGSAENPIIFTSLQDDHVGGDTNTDGGGSWPNAGDWEGLTFTSTSGGTIINYAQVLYGGTSTVESGAAITVRGANVNLTNSIIRYSAANGLRWFNGANGQITDNEISNHLSHALSIKESSAPTIQRNTIVHNEGSAVYLEGNSFPSFTDNTVYGNLTDGISVYGNVGAGRWYADISYVATQDLIIEFGNTLTLDPGTVVKFADDQDMIVRGSLIATGTMTNSIVFTSIKDDAAGGDTKQDGAATKPYPGDWGMLYFADTSDDTNSILEHVVIRYGGDAYSYGAGTANANLALDSASPTIRNSTFAASSRYGVQLLNVSSPVFQQNRIQDNTNHGVWISPSSAPAIRNNTFVGNGGHAVYVTGSSQAIFGNNQATENRVNGIGMAGTLNADTVWEVDLPYVVDGNLTLDLNTLLTIQPGVVVKFNPNAKLTINGNLQAIGNADKPIIFTAIKDDGAAGDTNGDGFATAPTPGDWEGLRFASTADASALDYATVRYGGSQNTTGAIFLEGSAPTLGHLTVLRSLYNGVSAQNASPILADAYLAENGIGLYNGSTAFASISNSTIFSNTQFGLVNANATYTLTATANWWGAASGPTHLSNPTGTGAKISGKVAFIAWLSAPSVAPIAPLLAFPPAPTYTQVNGAIVANTTWLLAQSPYLVMSDVTVNAGVQLLIEPGVIVKFAAGRSLTVNGILQATGTADQRIRFTSFKDDGAGGDTNGDGSATEPQAGDWGRIHFSDSIVDGSTVLRYADVRYGSTVISIDSASPTIEDNLITQNSGYGLSWRNYAAPKIQRNWILDNGSGGISLSGSAGGTVIDNQFWGNGGYAVDMDASCQPSFTGNVAHYNEVNGIHVTGNITFNQTWYANLPYVVEGIITVGNGPALTLQPGTVVKFQNSSSGIDVNGTLIADGTTAAPIIFTSLHDDLYGGDTDNDDGIYDPTPGNWGRITFADTSDDSRNLLRNVIVRYGGGQSVNITSAAPRVISSTIAYAGGSGIYLNNLANPRLEGNLFDRNNSDGISINGSSAPALVNNRFTRNGRYAVYFSAESKPTFSGNVATNNRYNAAAVSGTLAGATTWQTNLTYLVVNNLTLPSGAKLTIQPGAVIKFLETFGMTINGQLVANAPVDDSAPIVFTSLQDDAHGGDTNNEDNAFTPAPGDWGTLLFNSTSVNSSITHAIVRFGGNAAIKVDGTAINTEANIFYHNLGGVDFRTSTQVAHPINNNLFEANRYYAVWLKFADHTIINDTNTFLNNIGNAIRVSGSGALTRDTELLSGTVYWLDSWTVNANVTLTIPSNVVIKFNSAQGLTIQGKIVATGTITNPVVFTSIHQDVYGGDTNYNGNATTPAAGDWNGIVFADSADDTSLLKHVTIEYAGQANYLCFNGCGGYYYANLLLYKASPTIDHTTIRHSERVGIYAHESNFSLSHSTVQHNANLALYLVNDSSPTITANTISDNGSYGIYTLGAASLPVITGNTFANNQAHALNIRAEAVQLAVGNTYTGSTTNNTIYVQGGNLTTSGTWRNEGVPYLIAGAVSVGHESNPTLTIAPGNTLKFNSGTNLSIGTGKLIADGSAAPILFTSNATTPAAGDWNGIVFADSADDTSLLKHVTIEYAGQANYLCFNGCGGYYYANLLLYKASPTIDHTTIRHSERVGIYAHESNATVRNSNIYGNPNDGVYNSSTDPAYIIHAENNWWGTDSGPAPYGSGNGINYRTCTAPITNNQYICQFYVDADPWIGKTVAPQQNAIAAAVPEPIIAANTTTSSSAAPQPGVPYVKVRSTYGDFFLHGVFVNNRYAAEVDWNGSDPGDGIAGAVKFTLNNGSPTLGTLKATGADKSYNVGNEFRTGVNTLVIVAVNATGVASVPIILRPFLGDQPAWLTFLLAGGNMKTTYTADKITYGANVKFPEPAWKGTITIPEIVPAIGGYRFGLEDTQAELGIKVHSTGSGSLDVKGETGFTAAENNITGSVFGSGDIDFSNGLRLTQATMGVGVGGKLTTGKLPLANLPQYAWLNAIPGGRSIKYELMLEPSVEGSAEFRSDEANAHLHFDAVTFGSEMTGKAVLSVETLQEMLEASLTGGLTGGSTLKYRWPQGTQSGELFVDSALIKLFLEAKIKANLFLYSPSGEAGVAWLCKYKDGQEVECKTEKWASGSGFTAQSFARTSAMPQPLWQPIPRTAVAKQDYATFKASVHLQNTLAATSETQTELLVANLFEYAEPILATAPDTDNATLVWIHDDLNKPDLQNLELLSTYWDGSIWSTPSAITNDSYMDYNPQLAYDNSGHVVAVWERVRNASLPLTTTLDITYTSQIELAYAVLDRATNQWSAPTFLTDNNLFDSRPQLVRGQDGHLTLVWLEKPSGDYFDIAQPVNIYARTWDGTQWSALQSVATNVIGLLDYAVARYDASKTSVLLTIDENHDATAEEDQELYYSTGNDGTWSALTRVITNSIRDSAPSVHYTAAGDLRSLWLADDQLFLLKDNWSNPPVHTIFSDTTGTLADYNISIDQQGNLALVWQEQDEQGANLNYARYDDATQSWSKQAQLTTQAALIKQMSPAFTSGGQLMVGYIQQALNYGERVISSTLTITNVVELGQADLYVLHHSSGPDLVVEQLSLSDQNPAPGETSDIYLAIHNQGDTPADPVVVSLYDEARLVDSITLPQLPAGAMITTTIQWTMSTTLAMHHLQAVVDAANVVDEQNEENNVATLTTHLPDLAIANLVVYYDSPHTIVPVALLENKTGITVTNVPVVFYQEALTGTVLYSTTVAQLAPGELVPVTTTLDARSYPEGEQDLWAVISPNGTITETDRTNNEEVSSMKVLPDLSTMGGGLVYDIIDNTGTFTWTIENRGVADAEAFMVHLYAGTTISTSNPLLGSINIPPLTAGAMTTIQGTFTGSPVQIYGWIDPEEAIAQIRRSDDVVIGVLP